MNQTFLTGRVMNVEETEVNQKLMVAIYEYSPVRIDCIPVVVNENTSLHIGKVRKGDLVSILGKIAFERDSLKVVAEKVQYAG